MKERLTPTVLTNMVLIQNPNDGKLLVQLRESTDWGGITLPGGHVECGESFHDAAIREVFEETGLRIGKLRLCGIAQWYRKEDGARNIIFLYRTHCFFGEVVKRTREGQIMWIDAAQLEVLPLSKNFRPILEALLCDDATEAFGEWKADFTAHMKVL